MKNFVFNKFNIYFIGCPIIISSYSSPNMYEGYVNNINRFIILKPFGSKMSSLTGLQYSRFQSENS